MWWTLLLRANEESKSNRKKYIWVLLYFYIGWQVEVDGGSMEIKYLEWNLHAMGGIGYKIPEFICEYINSADIFVLVEFCMENGWYEFKESLKEFDLYCSPYVSKAYNQVCIGIRKKIANVGYKLLSVVSSNVCDSNIPEFLQVDIKIENKNLSVIGTRIKTQGGTQLQQFQYLKGRLNSIDVFCCMGDFNARYKCMTKEFPNYVYGPRIAKNYHSFVHENGDLCGLDWLISKGVTDVYNGYSDAGDSPYATYDWSFVDSKNGYGNKTKYDYLNINGLPDHAILKGMIKL